MKHSQWIGEKLKQLMDELEIKSITPRKGFDSFMGYDDGHEFKITGFNFEGYPQPTDKGGE